MMSRSRLFLFSTLFVLAAGGVWCLRGANSQTHAAAVPAATSLAAASPAPADSTSKPQAWGDKPLSPFQTELLETAFKAVSALPLKPHIKTRSRAQAEVVEACIELEQPQHALRDLEQIEDWRRGEAYANLAFYCVQHGDTTQAQHHLDLARQVGERSAKEETIQDWNIDRIKVAIAKTELLLGQKDEARKLLAVTEPGEAQKVEVLKATMLDSASFENHFTVLESIVAKGGFDQIRNALETCAQLFKRFYDDQDRRTRLEEKIETGSVKLPLEIQIGLRIELAGFAIEHGDQAKALELLQKAHVIMESSQWLPEDRLPLVAKLAETRYRAGQKEKARAALDAALALFDAQREHVVDIYRAGALRPLAEAYQRMGDTATALSVYTKAIEEGMQNPNSKPRAEDLCATCCSMAVHGVEPDAKLAARIKAICAGLGAPW